MWNNLMATPISQFDLSQTLSSIVDFVEKAFDFAPGARGILSYFGINPSDTTVMDLLITVSVLVSLVVAVGILYSIIRISQIRSTDKMAKRELHKRKIDKKDIGEWKKILKLAHTDNPHDWKLAVREADILLDVVVSDKGYRGTTFEEKIKRMPDSEDAEMAHEAWVNYIQKGGDEYMLTKAKTKEILGYYEMALKKLGYL